MGMFAVVTLHRNTLIFLQSSNETEIKWAICTDTHLNTCKKMAVYSVSEPLKDKVYN